MVDVKCETDSDGTKVFHHLVFVKIVPSDIPWHVYAKLTSLSGWTTSVGRLLSEVQEVNADYV